ncbi:hypothetical protein GF351_02005 [Candidatus Woesearchaeota archaeon]|nr:hypothetical protein [Candidatus Woesearchaeota archaeon]
MYTVHLKLTYECDLSCRHCYLECGPGGRSMSDETIDKVFRHLPESTFNLLFSGGEVTSAKKTFTYALDAYKDHVVRLNTGMPFLTIHTNGYWTQRFWSSLWVLKKLRDAGTAQIYSTGDTCYHHEQGVDPAMQHLSGNRPLSTAYRLIWPNRFFRAMFPGPIFLGGGSGEGQDVLPLGRARNLPEEEVADIFGCKLLDWRDDPSGTRRVTVDPDGMVYLCCWMKHPPIGNAADEPIEDMVERSLEDDVIKALMDDGVAGAAKTLGVFDQDKKDEYRDKACLMCEDLFGGIAGLENP